MNKTLFFLFLLFLGAVPLMAQNTIIGKWRPVRLYTPELGEFPIEAEPLRRFAYQKTLEEKQGQPLNAEDSAGVEELVRQIEGQFGSMTMEFKANKTYTGELQGEPVTGKYVYNAAKKQLITYPKGKPSRTAKLTFLKGQIKLENTGQKIVLYLQRI